ncbi:hypothetical protein [Cystobacter fuscus]|uniref:hypothetical protein n=1 Tax=Cystobacter fuscus TaxID=43 RepID=UPI0037BF56C1
MRIHDALISASRFAASQWQAARREGREEEKWLWPQVNEYRAFIGETGQVYLFEDYLGGIAPTPRPDVSPALDASKDATSHAVMRLLLKAFDETPEPEQKQSAAVFINLVNFIADTEQLAAVEDYVNNRLEYAPLAIAHFTRRDEAEAWLKGLAEPPSPARILIGDEYYLAWYSREENARDMYRDYIIEPYIEELAARGIPPATPTFETRAEAEGWLKNHPASPFAFVSIAGEHYLAVHHKRLMRHTLHPVASALTEWEETKRAAERERARDAKAEIEGE